MARYGGIDYSTFVKRGFALGVALFVLGAGGELVGHAALDAVPGWADAVLIDLEVLGILIGFFSPVVFGVVMPLTE